VGYGLEKIFAIFNFKNAKCGAWIVLLAFVACMAGKVSPSFLSLTNPIEHSLPADDSQGGEDLASSFDGDSVDAEVPHFAWKHSLLSYYFATLHSLTFKFAPDSRVPKPPDWLV